MRTLSLKQAFAMGQTAFRNGEPEVPETKMGHRHIREFLRGWEFEYFKSQRKAQACQ